MSPERDMFLPPPSPHANAVRVRVRWQSGTVRLLRE